MSAAVGSGVVGEVGLEAALGSGAAPEALVPCDLGGLSVLARSLRSHAAVLEEGASSLSRVEVTSWRGDASTAFADTIRVEPGRWLTAADAFLAGADAVDAYAASVPEARETASLAAQTYRRYQTMLAAAAEAAAVPPPALVDTGSGSIRDRMAIGARLAQLQELGQAEHAAALTADGLRRHAIDLLASARALVEHAGDRAADALDQAAANAPEARRFWEANIRPADIVGTAHTALDAAGMIPILGAVPDAANATWYGASGDTTNALISAGGMLPLLGDAIIGGRFVRGGVEAADAMAQRALNRLNDGGLAGHESGVIGHSLARHANKSDEFLLERISPPAALKQASTYADEAAAERYTYSALEAHDLDVRSWLIASPTDTLKLTTYFDHPVGATMFKDEPGMLKPLWGNVVRLRRDPAMPSGYRVVTSYPA